MMMDKTPAGAWSSARAHNGDKLERLRGHVTEGAPLIRLRRCSPGIDRWTVRAWVRLWRCCVDSSRFVWPRGFFLFLTYSKDGWVVLALPTRAVASQLRSFFCFMTVTCRRALATPSPLHLSLYLVRLNLFRSSDLKAQDGTAAAWLAPGCMLFDWGIFLVCVRSLFYRLLFFSPLKKRLMSPENSTRKVNTILKCQEINDIVLSSYGSVGEGDKCLALFTPVPPYLWSFPLSPWLSLSPCLFLIYSSSTIFSSPLPLPTPSSPRLFFTFPYRLNSTHTEYWSSGRRAVLLRRVRLSANEKRRSKSESLIFVRRQRDPNMWSFPPVKTRNFSLFTGPSNCILLLSSWRE